MIHVRLRSAPVFRSVSLTLVAEVAAVVAVLGALVIYVAPTLDLPLLEKHAFRQTQTAYTARVFHEDGIDLLHPKLPVFGEPFEAPFEFPLFQALASIPMELGVETDTALRATSLACFLLTALLLYGLVRYVAGPASGIAALTAFTLTPLAVVWSRTSMIEYLATAGAVGFAWALILWRDRRRPVFLALALAAGLVGMLVKPPTAVFWILPALAFRPTTIAGRARRQRFDPWTIVAVAVPLAAGSVWTRHADAIKAASPVTDWLTSWELRRWNFGWVRQRLDPDVWQLLVERAGLLMIGLLGILLLPAIVAAVRSRQWPFWVGIACAGVLPPLVFLNLYVNHDYYLAGVSPAFAALIGLGAGWIWARLRNRRFAVVALPVMGLVLVWGSLELGRGYWLRIHGGYEDLLVLPLAHEVQRHTRPDDLVAVVGLDWSPAVLYYAHRRGHMVMEHTADASYDRIDRGDYRTLLLPDAAHDDLSFLARWRWLGALGPHLYAIGERPGELSDARFLATDEGAELALRQGSGRTVGAGLERIACDRPVHLRSGARGTWIRLAEPDPNARVFVSGKLVPLPARRVLFVSAELANRGVLTLTCTGAASLSVAAVIDAPGPDA